MSIAGFTTIQPRVIVDDLGASAPLIDVIDSLLSTSADPRVIRIEGDGKSVALRIVADWFSGRNQVAVIDDEFVAGNLQSCQLVLTSNRQRRVDQTFALCNWGRDEFIDYLIVNHPEQCKSVMSRLAHVEAGFGEGSPVIWQLLLDAFAVGELRVDLVGIVRDEIEKHFYPSETHPTLNAFADELIEKGLDGIVQIRTTEQSREFRRLVRIVDVRIVLVSSRIAQRLAKHDKRCLKPWLRGRLLQAVADLLRDDSSIIAFLAKFIRQSCGGGGVAASLALRLQADWRPQQHHPMLDLSEGSLVDAKWSSITLPRLNVVRADLSRSDLSGSDLRKSNLNAASFRDANLEQTVLDESTARRANFSRARMMRTLARNCQFLHADFTHGDLRWGDFSSSSFEGANLSSADLRFANFDRCNLNQTTLEDVDFNHASFNYANLANLDLRNVALISASFSRAILRRVNLEQVDLSRVVFDRALMQGALLTASRASGASFATARMNDSGLAEIEWEDCDLRGADLRGVAFHMGSTRCGLVGSPYPSHGTRTGFYTDEHEDLYYKPPEQIRKACLVACDLRGAKLDNVDFYLVDLRRAKFDRRHRKHFAACGAILDD